MTNTRQQIAAHLAGFKDLQALKLAGWEWVNSSDVSLAAFAKALERYRVEPELTEIDWQQLQQQGLTFESDAASRTEDMQRLQRYRETGESIPMIRLPLGWPVWRQITNFHAPSSLVTRSNH